MKKQRNLLLALLSFVFVLSGCGPSTPPADSSETPPVTSEAPPASNEDPTSTPPTSVTPVAPESIVIKADGEEISILSIDVATTKKLSVTVLPEGASQDVIWESSSPGIARVEENNELKTIKTGFAIISVISAADATVRKNLTVSVTYDDPQEGIGTGLSPEDPIYKGEAGSDGPLEIYFMETFQTYADSMLLKKGNVEILIDGGYAIDGEKNKEIIASLVKDGRLDMVMASHNHADHVNAMPAILGEINYVSTFLNFGLPGSTGYGQEVDRFINQGAVHYTALDSIRGNNGAQKKYYLTPDFTVEVLNTGMYSGGVGSAENPNSLAVIFKYKDFTFYTAGDLEIPQELNILENEKGNLPELSLMKLSHHGSHGSNGQEFLDAMDPYMIMIPSSRPGLRNGEIDETRTNNLDGVGFHPRDPAVERTYKAPRISENLNVYWNVANGMTKFTTHGGATDVVQQGSPTRNGYYDLSLTDGVPIWDPEIGDFKNKVTGEENKKFHETVAFVARGYVPYLPEWARNEFFANM